MDFIITDQREASIEPCSVLPNCKVLNRSKTRLILSEGVPFGLIPKLINGRHDLIFCWRELTWACVISSLISKLMRKKFIIHSETWCYPRNTPGIIASVIAGQIIRRCDAIVVPGHKAKKFLMHSFHLNPDKFFLAPYAAFLFDDDCKNSKEKQMKIKKELGIEGKKIILYLSRIIEVKGLDYLVKAFSRLENERDDVFLVIGGTGDFEYKVQRLCASLKVKNVKFLGAIVNPEYKKGLYSMCSVFVLPSISMPYSAPCNEAFSLVINEAMSMGKAVVTTTAVGAADDLVINGMNGVVVEEKNVNELYDALRKMLSDDEMRRRMGLMAKEIVHSKFTYERQAEGIMNAIDYCKPKSVSIKYE